MAPVTILCLQGFSWIQPDLEFVWVFNSADFDSGKHASDKEEVRVVFYVKDITYFDLFVVKLQIKRIYALNSILLSYLCHRCSIFEPNYVFF